MAKKGDDKLIQDLINRVAQQHSKAPENVQDHTKLKGSEYQQYLIKEEILQTIISISLTNLNGILQGLCDYLAAGGVSDDIQMFILGVMANCMKSNIKNNLEGKVLDRNLVSNILAIVHGYLLKPLQFNAFVMKAGSVLNFLSALEPELVVSKITSIIQTGPDMKDGDETNNQYLMIENLNLNLKNLSDLLSKVCQAMPAYLKKPNRQLILAKVLRSAIWNWIDNYPSEFAEVVQKDANIEGSDLLFDHINDWSEKGKQKPQLFWPIQTMLLILCPGILKDLIKKDTAKNHPTKAKLLETLATSIKNHTKNYGVGDVAGTCYVDICKAATIAPKDDNIALRQMVSEIEASLDERLFDTKNPLRTPENDLDENLMIDILVYTFRLSTKKTMTSSFGKCFAEDAPSHLRIALVKSLLRIAEEGANLPWNPTLKDAYTYTFEYFRRLFQDYWRSANKYSILMKDEKSEKKIQKELEKLKSDTDILLPMIKLFRTDPTLPLFATGVVERDIESIRNIITGLCDCVGNFFLPELSEEASQTLQVFHQTQNINKWCPSKIIVGFWDVSCQVNTQLSNILIESKDMKTSSILRVMSLLENILEYRNNFLKTYPEVEVSKAYTEVRTQSTAKLETALLIHLCSGDGDICSKAANCFRLLCEEIAVIGADSSNVFAANSSVYEKIGSLGSLPGRVAQQLAFRKLLRKVERQTQGNYNAWLEVYDRWEKNYTPLVLEEGNTEKTGAKKVIKLLQDKTPTEIQQEWHNITGWLFALSGVTLNKELVIKAPIDAKAKKEKSQDKTVKVLEKFIGEVLEYLTADSKYVRESMMSLAGTSITASVYPVLIRLMIAEITKFFQGEAQVIASPKSTLFVDQSISLIKHIIELPQELDSLSFLSDFETLMEHFIKYVSQLLLNETTLRIKKTMCTLLESMMQKRQYISFRNEIKFRNNVVENILQWTSDFATTEDSGESGGKGVLKKDNSFISLNKSAEMVKLFSDLDIEALKAISSLLRGLPLSEGDSTDQKVIEKKKKRFSKYFTFFTQLLNRCKSEKKKLETKVLSDYTIQSLSNLLSANIDSGLQYFVTMGYHEDFETRTAFLKVITNILKQKPEFDLGGEETDKYEKLYELIFESNFILIQALSDIIQMTEMDELSTVIIRLFDASDKSLQLLQVMLGIEIQRTVSSNTLFRRNSMATKLLSAYSKIAGQKYLKDTLSPVIHDLIAKQYNYEIDPVRVPKGQNLETNIENVKRAAQLILNCIINSIDSCPSQFREICFHLKQTIANKFPGSEYIGIAGFLFLRFLCPGIVSPEGYGILSESPSQELRRGLILIAKILQNLASGVEFESNKKEAYMLPLNSFISENLQVLKEAMEKFGTLSPTSPSAITVFLTDEQKEADLSLLHYHIAQNIDKLSRNLVGKSMKNLEKIEEEYNSALFSRLSLVLQKLGPASEPNRKTNFQSASHTVSKGDTSLYDDFMKTYENRNTDKIKEKGFFFKHGNTRDKQPVFYIIARKFNSRDPAIDINILLYYILKTTQSAFNKPFTIVLDCTNFTNENALPLSWCSYFIKHFPESASEKLDRILLVNPNHEFKKYSKRMIKFLGKAQKKVIFLKSASKISEFILESESGLPSDTLAVEKDVKASFSPILKLSQYSQAKEMILRISSDYLQLQTIREHPVFGKPGPILDLFHVSTITEMSVADSDQELTIKFLTQGETRSITFKTTNNSAKTIIQGLNASKNLHKFTIDIGGRQLSNPSDVPGTLLNMALLNLGSDNELLRLAAYNMLDSICTNFNFSIQLHLFGTEGLCVPSNTFNFIVSQSEKLAQTQPQLTLEFLLECLQGLELSKPTPQIKHLCLDYMRPWLPNLSKFSRLSDDTDSVEKVEKTKQVIESLIDFTVKESSMVTIILSTIWTTIGKVSDIIEAVVGYCVEQSVKAGITSNRLDVIGSIVIAIASQNPQLVAGKILAKIFKTIDATKRSVIDRLDDHISWSSISTMLRLLFFLSFENLLHVQVFLPELFHLFILLFGTGSSHIRSTVYGLLINVVHSLYTSKVTSEDKFQNLSFHLSEFNQPNFKLLLGISGDKNVNAFSKPDATEKQLEKIPITNVDTVASSLYNVLASVFHGNNPVGTTWHSRWLSLTTQMAFTSNLALQPRAYITLGVLCKSPTFVTDDFVELLLTSLKEALRESSHAETSSSANDELSYSLILCLTRIYEYLPVTSPYFKALFWVAIGILQISDVQLFTAGLKMMGVILKLQENEGYGNVEEYYNTYRDGPVGQILAKLDNLTGLNFKASFSFGIAGNLAKGLKHPKTKADTTEVLSSFLDQASKTQLGANILGFLAALVPVEGESVIQNTSIVTPQGKNLHGIFFAEPLLPDQKNVVLLFALLLTFLQNTEKDYEKLFIYKTIKEGVEYNPESFFAIEHIVIPLIDEVIQKSQNPVLIQAVKDILSLVYIHKLKNSSKLSKDYLTEIGFPKLANCGSFEIDKEDKREISKVVILLLDNLLKEVRSKK